MDMEANHISDLQAVDFAFGGVIVNAYKPLADSGPEGFRRFLKRPDKEKIFRAENEDLLQLVTKVAQKAGDKDSLDLPLIAYYRQPGLAGGEEKARAVRVTGYSDDKSKALRLSLVPVALNYDIAFLAWDRLTLDRLTLAWHCYVIRFGQKHSKFTVPYGLDEEKIEVAASIVGVREILADNVSPDQSGGRLWAARTRVEIKTQVLYGEEVEPARDAMFTTGMHVLA